MMTNSFNSGRCVSGGLVAERQRRLSQQPAAVAPASPTAQTQQQQQAQPPPPPKPEKSDRVKAFAESLLQPKPTRASVRQLQCNRRVARLTQTFDKQPSNAGTATSGGGLGSSRWRSEENLRPTSGKVPQLLRRSGGVKRPRASVINEETVAEDSQADDQRNNNVADDGTEVNDSVKLRPSPPPMVTLHSVPGGGSSSVQLRIRAFESRSQLLSGETLPMPPRHQQVATLVVAPTATARQPAATVAPPSGAAGASSATGTADESSIYEDLRPLRQRPLPHAPPVLQGSRHRPGMAAEAENVYDIAGSGGFGMRRTASVEDIISTPFAPGAATSDGAVAAAAESEYATVTVRPDRTASASSFGTLAPAAAADAAAATARTQELWRSLVIERVSDSFSAFRKLSAVGISGAASHQRLADAATASDAGFGGGGSDDDDGSRSNVSEEVADRIRRAEMIKQRNEAMLQDGLTAKRMRHDQLFTGCCLIKMNLVAGKASLPSTSFCHPSAFASRDFSYALPSFCFPDSDSLLSRAGQREQLRSYLQECEKFSFVITKERGERYYGYCMRRLVHQTAAETGRQRAPSLEALCIVAVVESEQLYYQILSEAFRKRLGARSPEQGLVEVEEFMVSVYNRPLPNAGSWFDLTTTDSSRGGLVVSCRFQRPASGRLQHVSYSELLTFPGVQNSLLLFGAVLHERKIVLSSANPRRLSQCTQALAALLYPLRWQHTLVPIVPATMLRIVCSPTPYIVGVLAAHLPDVLQDDLDDDVLIVSLDDGRTLRQKGDEKKLLSKKLQRALFRSLDGNRQLESRAGAGGGRGVGGGGGSRGHLRVSELLIVETFLRFFVAAIGHYGEHIVNEFGSSRRFDRDSFCNAPRSKGLRALLKVLTATGNFHVFISDVLDGSAYDANKLTVSTVLRDFDSAVLAFRDEVERHGGGGSGVGGGGGGFLDGFRSKMKKLFTAGNSRGDVVGGGGGGGSGGGVGGRSSGTLSSSYPTKASVLSLAGSGSSGGAEGKPALPPRR